MEKCLKMSWLWEWLCVDVHLESERAWARLCCPPGFLQWWWTVRKHQDQSLSHHMWVMHDELCLADLLHAHLQRSLDDLRKIIWPWREYTLHLYPDTLGNISHIESQYWIAIRNSLHALLMNIQKLIVDYCNDLIMDGMNSNELSLPSCFWVPL